MQLGELQEERVVPMNGWELILEILLLLGLATLLGILFEHFRQSSVVGYLIAGILLGPSVLGVIEGVEVVRYLAELGVALLLFTIGLEFSWSRLKSLGLFAIAGGSLQIVITGTLAFLTGRLLGLAPVESFIAASSISLSSTAVVLRVLADRAELESLHGRNVLGILLMQDLAVVPLVLIVSALSRRATGWETALEFGDSVARAAVFLLCLYLLTRFVLPRMLSLTSIYRSRDLPVLLAITIAMGATWASHAVGLSPILGAFVAGLLLAESPFAEQTRAEISPLRAAFVTLFFTSIGTLAPVPISQIREVLLVALFILLGKGLVVAGVSLIFRQPLDVALASGLALAQMGEFSFVLTEQGLRANLLSRDSFHVLVSASVLTLLLTPYLLAALPHLRDWVRSRKASALTEGPREVEKEKKQRNRVVVVGYGPAGRKAVEVLVEKGIQFLVLDFNPKTVGACGASIPIVFGDARRPDILERLDLHTARVVAITVPDTESVRLMVRQIRRIDPEVQVIVRNRYHAHAEILQRSGAECLVDEEELVGRELGTQVVKAVGLA